MIYLDSPIHNGEGDETDATLGDHIPHSNADVQQSVETAVMKEAVHKVLDKLNAKERFVIVRRFGLNDGPQMTLQEIGDELGVTRERVRQIETTAMRKLRVLAGKSLRVFYEE